VLWEREIETERERASRTGGWGSSTEQETSAAGITGCLRHPLGGAADQC